MILNSVQAASTRLAGIASATTDHLAAQRQALAVIRQTLPFDFGSFATTDPATVLWTSCVLHGLDQDPSREALMFDNEYRQNDLLKVSSLSRTPELAARMSAVDREVRKQSPRYQMIRSVGVVDELRCALVDAGNCWGSFEIYRLQDTGTFTDEDVRKAALLAKPLARLVRLALLRQAASMPDAVEDPPGVLVLDHNGSIEAMSPSCDRWIEDMGANDSVPAPVRSLVMKLTGGSDDGISMVTPRVSGGWIRLHATRLHAKDKEQVSVVLEPVKPAVLSETIAHVYRFTQRESEVITWMARGLSTKEIGEKLGISPFTVNDHAKALFQKTGVQSRQQLIATLFFDHCLPLREQDAVPGPYGWFMDRERSRPLARSGN